MAKELAVADREMVITENKLEALREDVKRLEMSKEALQNEINKKSADYELYIGKRESDARKLRDDALASQDLLSKEKEQFTEVLLSLQKDKQAFEREKQGFENAKRKLEGEVSNVKNFIAAVRRACSLLGL